MVTDKKRGQEVLSDQRPGLCRSLFIWKVHLEQQWPAIHALVARDLKEKFEALYEGSKRLCSKKSRAEHPSGISKEI